MKRALFIMAKEPTPGKVKTRMCPPLTPQQAADFYRCFLQDVLAGARSLCAIEELKPLDLFLAYDPPQAESFFHNLAGPAFRLFPQEGEDLTARIINGFGRLFDRGYTTVAVLGSDSPTLNPQKLTEGFLLLEKDSREYSLTIKPSADGGYCFLAMNQFYPQVFEGIDWSTPEVFAQTKIKLRELGLSWFKLDAWYDLDTIEDLRHLDEMVKNMENTKALWPAGRETVEFYKQHLLK